MIKDRNDIGTRPPLHSTNQTWNCQFMKNWRYHRTNGQNWKKDPKFHRHKRWTRLRHPRSWRTSPPRVSVASFYPALVSHSCVARASVSQCLNVTAEETHCELRALLRILYPIPDATSCKLQLNTFILWKAHCAMRVAANIVLLKCHAALHEHQKMLELSWSVVVLIH